MPDQFDVHAKPGARNPAIPFVIVVQSISGTTMRWLDPLRITGAPVRTLGEPVASLAEDDGRIINALDTLLSRAWR